MQRNKTHKLPSFCSPSIPAAMVICFGDCSFAFWVILVLLLYCDQEEEQLFQSSPWLLDVLDGFPHCHVSTSEGLLLLLGGWILCNLSTLGFGWVFFSLVSSVLCILLILVKASFLSLPKQNAVWMPSFPTLGTCI